MMRNLDAALEQIGSNQVKAKELTQDSVNQLFNAFREKMRAEERSALHAQMLSMQVECAAPDEVRIISPSQMADSYAQTTRNELLEYFSKEAGGPIRVTTELRLDESLQPATQVLSKQEIYEQMAAKNPLLTQLRDGLNMQIDY